MFNRDKLVELLNSKGWSRYKLSQISGVAQTTLRDIFGAKQVTPSTKTLEKLASALNVSISVFFDEENEKTKAETPIEKINALVKENKINTIAAHFDDEEFTDDDVYDIENFIKYVVSKRKNKR
ncbi:MAG: helix-turn-helix transcriptional regulator [Clostridium sp.]